MKVTLEGIKAKIKGETYLVLPDGKSTLCILDLENGFSIKGLSACVDPAEFDLNMGRKLAFEDAIRQIWPLEGYLLAEKMHLAKLVDESIASIVTPRKKFVRKVARK
jgi:hypothetical protein